MIAYFKKGYYTDDDLNALWASAKRNDGEARHALAVINDKAHRKERAHPALRWYRACYTQRRRTDVAQKRSLRRSWNYFLGRFLYEKKHPSEEGGEEGIVLVDWGLPDIGEYLYERGDPEGAYRLAQDAEYPNEGAPDMERAVAYYTEAAEKGHKEAQYKLGYLFSEGDSVEQNYATAAHWFLKAAENNHADALYAVALMYRKGLYFDRDPDKADVYCEKAAAAGSAQAKTVLAQYYLLGIRYEQDLARAEHLLCEVAAEGEAVAMWKLGQAHYKGLLRQDYFRAYDYLKEAFRKGEKRAGYELGLCYFYGNGAFKDRHLAACAMRAAAQAGSQKAAAFMQAHSL